MVTIEEVKARLDEESKTGNMDALKVKIHSKSVYGPLKSYNYPDQIGWVIKTHGDGSGRNAYNCIVVSKDESMDMGGNFFALQDLEWIIPSRYPTVVSKELDGKLLELFMQIGLEVAQQFIDQKRLEFVQRRVK